MVNNHLGHASSITEEYYGHLDKSAKIETVKRLGEAGLEIFDGDNSSETKDKEKSPELINK